MSMRAWTIEGIGFYIDQLSKDDLFRIVQDNIEIADRLICGDDKLEYLHLDTPDELFNFLSDNDYESIETGERSPFAVIADIISEREGITIEYHHGEYEEAIMMSQGMPWHFNEKELSLGIKGLEEIFAKYFSCGTPDYVSVEYFG